MHAPSGAPASGLAHSAYNVAGWHNLDHTPCAGTAAVWLAMASASGFDFPTLETRPSASFWFEAARPKTLPAAVIPVLVGAALAWRGGGFDWRPGLLCLGFALLVQIGTNFANDYGDFVRGADRPDRLGPRRAVASGLIAPSTMARAALGVFGAAFLLGLALVWWRGWELLPVGIASLLFGWAYTGGPLPLAYCGLGDVFVFVFFGVVAVAGTFYVMTGTLDWTVFAAAVPVGLLATNILVVNNFRDRESDARAGKRTLVVRYGAVFALHQYAWSWLAAAIVPLGFAILFGRPLLGLPAIALPFGIRLLQRLGMTRGAALNGVLADTAKWLLIFGVAWSVVLAVG